MQSHIALLAPFRCLWFTQNTAYSSSFTWNCVLVIPDIIWYSTGCRSFYYLSHFWSFGPIFLQKWMCHSSSKFKQIHRLQTKSVLHFEGQHLSSYKQRPPPLLGPYVSSVTCYILIHSVSAAHSVIVQKKIALVEILFLCCRVSRNLFHWQDTLAFWNYRNNSVVIPAAN